MIGPIKTVGIYVEDQQKAVEFYTQKLGFEIRRNQPMDLHANWAEFKPSVVFHCPDVEATCRRLMSLGARVTMPPTPMAWGTFAKALMWTAMSGEIIRQA